MQHHLRPLLQPDSIALVGASERVDALGRIVYERLLASDYRGQIYPVNPAHREVLGRRAWPSLAAIGAPIDLVLIAAPPRAVVGVVASARAAKVAVIMTAPAGGEAESAAWSRDIRDAAKRAGVRVVGPGALGVIRPSAGLDATWCAPTAVAGRLALIAQSGAVATAMLDFATPHRIGFSAVISVGGAIDIGFGELLDLLLLDDETDGILVHVEAIRDARAFLSALRAAARTKPVIVLRAGRSLERPAAIPHDDVFDAALMRCGTVRVRTYLQLFAAAGILARGRIPAGDRIAIVSNGRGPAVLAADSALDRRLELARLTDITTARLGALLNNGALGTNPIDVHGDSPPGSLAHAVGIAAEDPNVDAVVALHVPRPVTSAIEAARALASVAAAQPKPILAAWLGAVVRADVQEALDVGGVSNFYTPETAVEALSFLAEYRNNQALLLEVPPPQPEPQPPDLAPLETLRAKLAVDDRHYVDARETHAILAAFGFVAKAQRDASSAIELGIERDARFGPVIFVRPARAQSLVQRRAVTLPPINARLAADLVAHAAAGDPQRIELSMMNALIDALTRLSALACMLPWVNGLVLDAVVTGGGRLSIRDASLDIDPQRRLMRGYPHMAIHPYPVELIGDVTLPDGTSIHVRPIRPEDAALEQALMQTLSDETRYYRFFYRVNDLT